MDYLKDLVCEFSKAYIIRLNGKRLCILSNKENNCSRIIVVDDVAVVCPIANW